ncbi:SDR family oxidoreductase [Pseudoxanthomonas sp. z9]|uniref:SDR family oxidoreductase n=1 Tax=Pseudoxanthomonas sp. z9 TaxID=2584942 RepID=UPI0011422812|nr:SDR family oxidoreductase [Pseudoxanthomonas sp. z9]
MRLAGMALTAILCLSMAGTACAWESTRKTSPAQAPGNLQDPYQQRIQDIAGRFQLSESRRLNRELKTILADRRFEALPDVQRHGLLIMAAAAAAFENEGERSRSLFLRSIQIKPSGYAWYMLSMLEMENGQNDQAALYLGRALAESPDELVDYPEELVPEVLRASTAGSDAKFGLLKALYEAGWNQRGLGASDTWFKLAEEYLRRGEPIQARGPIERIDGAMALIKLRIDRRFDGVMSKLEGLPSPEQAAQRRVERLRRLVTEQPRRLEPLSELMGALLVVGQWDEVVRLSSEVKARLKEAPADAPPFDDVDQYLWVQNRRSTALRALGRWDEAVAELAEAARTPDRGQTNVNQVLNLGGLYCSLGRPDDALAAIALVGEMSGYGKMVQASVQLCAATLKQDTRGIERTLGYLRKHRADGEDVLLDGLVSTGRLDEAAVELIAQLEALDTRAETLLSIQELKEHASMPGDVESHAQWEALVARADVQAAVARLGRIEHYPLYWGWDDH